MHSHTVTCMSPLKKLTDEGFGGSAHSLKRLRVGGLINYNKSENVFRLFLFIPTWNVCLWMTSIHDVNY